MFSKLGAQKTKHCGQKTDGWTDVKTVWGYDTTSYITCTDPENSLRGCGLLFFKSSMYFTLGRTDLSQGDSVPVFLRKL